MKRQRVRIATAIVATAALSGCFDDPTSSLRNGPAELRLSRTAAVVPVADSVLVEANVVDDQGNILTAEGATWTTDDPSIATVDLAAAQLPANGSSRAYIKGIASLGGITTVRVTIRGVSDSVRVTALPNRFLGSAGLAVVTGTPTPDTTGLGIAQGCAGPTAGECFTAGDTLTVTAAAGTTFDATSSVVTLGGTATQLLSRSATTLKVLSHRGYIGRVTVTNVTWLGSATTGDILLASVETPDSITISRVRMRGTVAVAASALGPNTEMTITAGPGTTFNTAAPLSVPSLGGLPMVVLSRTANQIIAIATAPDTVGVKVTNINLPQPAGTVVLDSLVHGAATIIAGAYFPGTVTNGTSRLLDTIVVNGAGAVTFGANSVVSINGSPIFVISQSASEIRGIARVPGLDDITVTNVIGPSWTYSTLNTSTLITVNSQITGEANEPGNNNFGTGTVITGPANVGDTVTYYGAFNTDNDYIKFTPATTGTYRAVMDWVPTTIDADIITMTAQFPGYACGGPVIVDGCGGATGADPEISNFTGTAGTQYGVWVNLYDAHGVPVPAPYRLRIIRIS